MVELINAACSGASDPGIALAIWTPWRLMSSRACSLAAGRLPELLDALREETPACR
jgi:hypothetical protein